MASKFGMYKPKKNYMGGNNNNNRAQQDWYYKSKINGDGASYDMLLTNYEEKIFLHITRKNKSGNVSKMSFKECDLYDFIEHATKGSLAQNLRTIGQDVRKKYGWVSNDEVLNPDEPSHDNCEVVQKSKLRQDLEKKRKRALKRSREEMINKAMAVDDDAEDEDDDESPPRKENRRNDASKSTATERGASDSDENSEEEEDGEETLGGVVAKRQKKHK